MVVILRITLLLTSLLLPNFLSRAQEYRALNTGPALVGIACWLIAHQLIE